MDCAGICSAEPPVIVRRGPAGRAHLLGTGLELADVLAALEEDGSVTAVAERLGLPEDRVRLALAWYERRPDDVDRELRGRAAASAA